MITHSTKPVRSVEPVKPTGVNAPEKPRAHGKSNPANAIKKLSIKEPSDQKSVVGAAKSPNPASGLKNPVPVRPELSSVSKYLTGESSIGRTISTKELFIKTAANMGFPKDALSVALLVFARYFSISLSPALIKTLRRDILASGKPSAPETPAEKAALEAEALSTLIALDKGVVLSPQAQEHYAYFLSFPDENFSRQDEKEDRDLDRDRDREKSPDAEELRNLLEEQEQKDGALAFLNHLPGKNGQHWLVFPFSVKVKGIEFQVFLRLLKRDLFLSGKTGICT